MGSSETDSAGVGRSAAESGRVNNQRGLRSREEILEVASRLMAERGYAATTLSTLSRETGLPKSSVYHHFASKEGLLSAVMAGGARRFFDAMVETQQDPPAGTPGERVRWFLQRTGDVFASHGNFLRLFLHLTVSSEAITSPDVARIVTDVRTEGRLQMRRMIETAFAAEGAEAAAAIGEELSYFGIAGFDGAFIGSQVEEDLSLSARLDLLAEAIARLGEARVSAACQHD